MLKLCCALGAVGGAAYTAPLARHRRLALRTPSLTNARAPARHATTEWTGSDVDPWNPISEDRVFEVCYLDEAGEHIEECVCESEAELIEKGLVPPRRGKDNSDLLFAVPNSGADGETLFSLADYETCLADDICVVPDEIVDKAYGPDILEKIKAERGEEETAAIPSQKAARFHVHFGAGRLGLGLVVPAIAASGVPFAVVQRPKPRWEQIFSESEEIDVCVNGEVKMKGAQVLAAHERPPVRDSEFQTNLNVTRSRRWRLHETASPRRRRRGRQRVVSRRRPFRTGDGAGDVARVRGVLRRSSITARKSYFVLLLPRCGHAKGHDLDPFCITGSSLGDRCSHRDAQGTTAI
jgi:hypothetical protein